MIVLITITWHQEQEIPRTNTNRKYKHAPLADNIITCILINNIQKILWRMSHDFNKRTGTMVNYDIDDNIDVDRVPV